MAGEGLIWSGIGQGIANAGSTMGQYLMQQQMKSEDRAWREQQAQDQRDWRAEQNSIYKRTAEEQMAGRAGAGKADAFKPEDTQPGGRLAGTAAGMLETNEDRLADYQKYRKTGEIDLEKYGQEVPNRGEENVVAGSKEVPQALKEEFKLKAKMLSQLEESYYLKGSYDDATKGRATAWKTAMGQAAFDKPEVAGKAGQAVAVFEGKPSQNIEGGQQYNQYTGESKTTPLGKAQIGKENAQAGELGALGKKYGKDIEKIDAEIQGGMFNKNSSERLTSVINAANGTIKSLNDGGKGSTPEAKTAWQKSMDDAVAVRDQAQALQKGALEAKANPPAPKPETGGMPEPKSAADVAKLKPGTRFKAPDGSIRIR
jgi:hypothetical protein